MNRNFLGHPEVSTHRVRVWRNGIIGTTKFFREEGQYPSRETMCRQAWLTWRNLGDPEYLKMIGCADIASRIMRGRTNLDDIIDHDFRAGL